MNPAKRPVLTRRTLLGAGVAGGLAAVLGRGVRAAADGGDAGTAAVITRSIPASGERLPIIGLGTNAFSLAQADTLRALLARFSELGATLIDTAAAYGESEEVLGRLIEELGLRSRVFLATKLGAGPLRMGPPPGTGAPVFGKASLERSLQRLRTDHLDLLQVHNLHGAAELLPELLAWKKAGRVRYIGITTSVLAQHAETAALLRRHPFDFVQVDYSLANRDAATSVFPVARQRGVAVIVNMPLGGRRGGMLGQIGDRPLPDIAAGIGARSWAQLLLKYAAAHPAVTAVISGSTQLAHLEDNQQAARGALPDAELRRRLEEYWDRLAG
jgi:aryl-alcohol dehydrogenase-like predicted oxidoreductase